MPAVLARLRSRTTSTGTDGSAESVCTVEAVTAAIFGLLGVVVGGVLNGLVGHWQVRRAESGEVRAAARLLTSDLVAIHTYVMELEGSLAPERPTLTRWQEFEVLLARTLPLGEWDTIRSGAMSIVMLDRYQHDEQLFTICKNSLENGLEALSGPSLYGTRLTTKMRARRTLNRMRQWPERRRLRRDARRRLGRAGS
jgi:hypothetical protein